METYESWIEKMKAGMRLMYEACNESCYKENEGGCEICPFGDICGPIPYDPDCWYKYFKE